MIDDSISNGSLPLALPTLEEKISTILGFQFHLPYLPQTLKNADKAVARLLHAGSESLSSRFERDTALRRAKTKFDERLLEATGDYVSTAIVSGHPIVERALDYTIQESILKQSNRERITRLALEHAMQQSTSTAGDAEQEIDDDWLNAFSSFASTKSSEDIQILWSKILSGKIRGANKFSVKSLNLLASIDRDDARTIHKVISSTIAGMFIFKRPDLTDLREFITCDHLGVLSGSTSSLEFNADLSQGIGNLLTLSKSTLRITSSISTIVPIPCFFLTRFGRELYSFSDDLECDQIYEHSLIAFLKARGLHVQRVMRSKISAQHANSIQWEQL
ncbi:DUF2806 domain-containing protein [Methylocella silvestris]|uniref:DUF2806 domain-containing protein n=1 Tax=Methylocella silvestris TaxID=199596 RepID=A0A2J7TJS0_METSI|nr:DUF2806 domain-containing protein [Methylocella silvestris]PNG27015.1 hypothetical protein CR492_04745 [Methylocella silvestris]